MNAAIAAERSESKYSHRKRSSSPRKQHGVQGGSSQANQTVVAILEVLAGMRSPSEAASALNISLVRYYLLEKRALEGMAAACEPKPLGKQPSPQARIASLEKELQQARRECARQQALVRAAQRSVGLSATAAQKAKASPIRDKKGRKKRRPTVRALKAAKTLREKIAAAQGPEIQQQEAPPAPSQQRREEPPVASC